MWGGFAFPYNTSIRKKAQLGGGWGSQLDRRMGVTTRHSPRSEDLTFLDRGLNRRLHNHMGWGVASWWTLIMKSSLKCWNPRVHFLITHPVQLWGPKDSGLSTNRGKLVLEPSTNKRELQNKVLFAFQGKGTSSSPHTTWVCGFF